MVQSRVRSKPGPVTSDRPRPASDDGFLLVAALAATLVEHRRATRHRNEQVTAERADLNWRTIARLEQLRGQT